MRSQFCHEFKTKSFHVYKRTKTEDKEMAYAIFASSKLILTGQLNSVEIQMVQRSTEQYNLAVNSSNLSQQVSSIEQGYTEQIAEKYNELATAADSDARQDIQDEINAITENRELATADLNREIERISVVEARIEMEVKRLETQKSSISERLKNMSDAEAQGIQNATPKFKGLG